ncbi:class I SAM-dependent methyltransferase [Streptomyces sp. NBC_00237]|uniref:class I SAM-dependent methyltransferase n=1 Tax=Streptomyces sp. NBC_00237 TaxID=2975687 RepID=UPI00224F6EBC|nr:class I SAM-dependent methyltransferase [Streptomyces sp. NBC_00237]MCX5203025.1 class I SAM-dependent methyltransferase [Streptomyces sp. NBC_00237]
MLDYDTEAARYDETRGGVPRAEAASASVLGLVPEGASTLLDVGCGTGIVTARLAAGRPGLRVRGVDAAHGMLRKAAERLGEGGVVRADARRLPVGEGRLDAVTAVWLLHLVDAETARGIVREAARVLRPGGVFVATVDKDAAHDVGSDIDAVLGPWRDDSAASDRTERVVAYGAAVGLAPYATARFVGHGQGRTPSGAAESVVGGGYASWFRAGRGAGERVAERLRGLPNPAVRRAEPVYEVLGLRKRG